MPCRGYANVCPYSPAWKLMGFSHSPPPSEGCSEQPQTDTRLCAPRDALGEAHSQDHGCVRFLQIWHTALEGRAVYPPPTWEKEKNHDSQAASEFSTILSGIKNLLICNSHPYFHLEVTNTGTNEPAESLHFLALTIFTDMTSWCGTASGQHSSTTSQGQPQFLTVWSTQGKMNNLHSRERTKPVFFPSLM